MNTMPLMAVALAGWINRQQQDVIEYHSERHHQGLGNKIIDPMVNEQLIVELYSR